MTAVRRWKCAVPLQLNYVKFVEQCVLVSIPCSLALLMSRYLLLLLPRFHHTPSLSRLTICPLHLSLYQCCISFLPTTRLLSYPPCFWVLTSTLEPFLFLLCKHNVMMCEAVLSARCFWFWPVEVLMSEMYLYTVSTSCIDLLLNVWSICASVKQLLWSGTVEIELCYRNYSSFWVYDDTF